MRELSTCGRKIADYFKYSVTRGASCDLQGWEVRVPKSKSEKAKLESVMSESLADDGSREQAVAKLRSAAERFYE